MSILPGAYDAPPPAGTPPAAADTEVGRVGYFGRRAFPRDEPDGRSAAPGGVPRLPRMRRTAAIIGLVMTVQGVSGAIDHLAVQPFLGPLLNFFNRQIIPRVDALTGYELFANLLLAALGVVVMAASGHRS